MSTRPRADNSPGQWGPDERLHALRLCPLFRYWPETRLVEVAAIARARSYARGTDVAAHRRAVIVVAAGGLEISRGSAAGKRTVLGVAGAPGARAPVLLRSEVRLPADLSRKTGVWGTRVSGGV